MPDDLETIAYCDSCGAAMNVSDVAPYTNVICPTCEGHTRVKREFGPYTLVRRHAVGGMSMVFVAHDNTLDREVALKILSEEYSSDMRRVTAFEEEARITASFSHPNVVRVLTTGKAFGRLYIAMELVPGGHFEHQIRVKGKIPEIEMLPFAIEVAEGLKAAHAAGLIHRDIKPGNILLDSEGHAKIVDFGLALVTQGGKAQAKEIWATPYYVPPETIEGHPEDFRSDIYAFGATIYHALAGVPPCGEESMATNILREAKKRVIPLGQADPTLSEATCMIVEKAMAYSPDDRYSSYDEMINHLHTALTRLKSVARGAPETSGKAAKRRALKKKRERISLIAATVILLLALSAGVWWVSRDKSSTDTTTSPLPGGPPVSNGIDTNNSSTEVSKIYQDARSKVDRREYTMAAEVFTTLFTNPSVQEPTRTWAGIEAIVADYLDGESGKAREQAKATVAHVRTLPNNVAKPGEVLIKMLDQVQELPGIPSANLDAKSHDAADLMAWMLAGLKNWEQGRLADARVYLSAVVNASLSDDDMWLGSYQKLAKNYLADADLLSDKVFESMPNDVAECRAAIAKLDIIVSKLKTRGRARFNVRAWQLDLTRQAKLIASTKTGSGVMAPAMPLDKVLERLTEYSVDCKFAEAAEFIKSLSADPKGAKRSSLLALAEAAEIFLADLENDLKKQPVSGAFSLKSGATAKKLMIDPDGELGTVTDDGKTHPAKWSDFSVEAIITLHRTFVAAVTNEEERIRRHECAIAFDWLAGSREHALSAATVLAGNSPEFKKHWEDLLSGLPR